MPDRIFIDTNVVIYALGQDSSRAHVASALDAGCDTQYSKDMQHGQEIYGRLHIVNPFI